MRRAHHLPATALPAALALGALLLATACEPEPAFREDRRVSARTQDIPELVDGNNAFALDIYQQVTAGEEGNVFLSPFSISSALAMTYAGARTTTAEAMADTLHITLDDDRYHTAFGALTRDLDGEFAGRAYELNIANRLFGQTGYEFGADFLAINADDYGAPLEELDFNADPEGSRETINTWVSEQTKEKIPELLKPGVISSDTRLVLTNAIYFKAFWVTQFDPQDTYDGLFRTPTGNVTVPLMNMETEAEYAYLDDVTVLRLPYEDDEVSMLFVLPHDDDGLAAVEAGLTVDGIDGWTDALQETEVMIAVPRFEMRFQTPLKEQLEALGMGIAFDGERADFSGITDTGMFISEVVHEAYVKVDEEGTEAAAATAVVMEDSAVGDMFYADHPFLFLIRDDLTGSILFMGRVVDPS